MEELPIFVAGLVVGLVLAAIAAALRGRSVADLGSTAPRAAEAPAAEPHAAELPAAEPGPAAPITADDSTSAGPAIEATPHGLHVTRRVVRRVETKLEPGGVLTITVDGQVYHHLDDVPDAATREQVRATLEGLPAMVTDPVQRDKVAGELRDAGIDEAPS